MEYTEKPGIERPFLKEMETTNTFHAATKTGAKMKIIHDEKGKTLLIKDGFKTQFWIMKFSLVCTIFNSFLFVFFELTPHQQHWFGYFWIFLGILSAGLLINSLFYKTGREKIRVSDIAALQEKILLGRKTHRLKLTNGRTRNLLHLKTQREINELYDFFSGLGIKTA